METVDYRDSQHDVTLIHDRMPNPFQSVNGPQSFVERCPLCVERYDTNCFLEYGVGRLFVICFGCNRKFCSSAKPGCDPRYTPCQFAMDCTCDVGMHNDQRCYECDVDDSTESMMWFDHVRLVLAGIHYLFACAGRIMKAGAELTIFLTVEIWCACINKIPGLPVSIDIRNRTNDELMNKLRNSMFTWTTCLNLKTIVGWAT